MTEDNHKEPEGIENHPVSKDDTPEDAVNVEETQAEPIDDSEPLPVESDIPEDDVGYDSQPEDTWVESKPDVKDNPEEYSGIDFPRGINENVGTISSVFKTVDEARKENPYHITSLPCDVETLESLIQSYPSTNYDLGEGSREWKDEIWQGSRLINQGQFLSKAVSREGSVWAQRVPFGTGTLGISRPKLGGQSGDGTHISGELASLRARQALGLGSVHNIPMWHSGFWATFKAPSAAARLEVQRRISEEKVNLGRQTMGLAFSNISVYIQSYLVDFALAHLSIANIRYNQPLELKDHLLATDIPMIIWGILTTLYPNGYNYYQPCINDPSKCQHIAKEIIDISKICFTDVQALTQNQKDILSKRNTRITEEDLKSYRKDHRYNEKGLKEIETDFGSLKFQFKVPTINEYFEAGFAWVDGITNAIDQAFGSDMTGERRNDFIMERAAMTQLCEFSQWVKEIGFDDGTVIDDVETIRATLADMSDEPAINEQFFKGVTDYMEECTISMVAIPKFDCPNCGVEQSSEEKAHPYLNPINVESLFFMTLDQLLEKVLSS